MTNASPLWVCDTCTLIDILTNDPKQQKSLEPIVTARANNEFVLGVSEVSIAECCKLEVRKTGKKAIEIIDEYLAGDNSQRFPVTAPVSFRANLLIRRFHLETCDALILATALVHHATRFLSRDSTSLCKRIRSSQRMAAATKDEQNKPKDKDKVDAEQRVWDELESVEIHELKTPEIVVEKPRVKVHGK